MPASLQGMILQLAQRTGLEPATPGVTGRYSNQLNYRSAETNKFSGPLLRSQHLREETVEQLVGTEGFEPPTLSV